MMAPERALRYDSVIGASSLLFLALTLNFQIIIACPRFSSTHAPQKHLS
jgi:hypothetical protein